MGTWVIRHFGFESLQFFFPNSAYSNIIANLIAITLFLSAFWVSLLLTGARGCAPWVAWSTNMHKHGFVQPMEHNPTALFLTTSSRSVFQGPLWLRQSLKETVSCVDSTSGCEVTNTQSGVRMRLAKSHGTMIKRCCNESICCMQQTQLLDKLPLPLHSYPCSKRGLENIYPSGSKPWLTF